MFAPFSQFELYALGNYTTFLPSRAHPAKAARVLAADRALVPNTGDPYNGIVIRTQAGYSRSG